MKKNVDKKTIEHFGREWQQYDQSIVDERELRASFEAYFAMFPWRDLGKGAIGMDVGCGSGRWASLVAPRVGVLHCVDPSARALRVARKNLRHASNCRFHLATADDIPLPDDSLDFGYSLGVLHHIPDTARALTACVRKLRPGAPFLVYLYYAFDNRPMWFTAIWHLSDIARRGISSLPFRVKLAVTVVIATMVYWPMARFARALQAAGLNVANVPLSAYRNSTFYTMRTDALDRFGTRLEQRFTRRQIQTLMEGAGLHGIEFGELPPFWCAVGRRCRQPVQAPPEAS